MKQITLPLPPKELSPNVRVHWRDRAKATQEYRATVKLIAINHRNIAQRQRLWEEPTAPAVLSLVWHYKDKRLRDYDNCLAACKALIDGLVDAGWLLGDNHQVLSIGRLGMVTGEHWSKGDYIVATIEEVPHD